MIRDRPLVVRDVQRDSAAARPHPRALRSVRARRAHRRRRPDAADGAGRHGLGLRHAARRHRARSDAELSADEARAAIAARPAAKPSGAAPELVVLPHPTAITSPTPARRSSASRCSTSSSTPARRACCSSTAISSTRSATAKAPTATTRNQRQSLSGTFVADDPLRPAALTTYDMKGNLDADAQRAEPASSAAGDQRHRQPTATTTGRTAPSSMPTSTPGWYYDFLFKRFARHGLDNRDLRMPLSRIRCASRTSAGAQRRRDRPVLPERVLLLDLPDRRPRRDGVRRRRAPRHALRSNIDVKPFSAALDVVAHELTHGVTANTARLNGFPYSDAGALNEAFSDMFGVATAFFYQTPGNAALQASYVIGKDLSVPSGAFAIRDRSSTRASTAIRITTRMRFLGGDPHFNSTIASHAFYLAIEGGTNRTSGRTVQGVGAANREQIEKIVLPRADGADAVELDLRPDARRDDPGGARSLRRRQRRRARGHAGVGRGRRPGTDRPDRHDARRTRPTARPPPPPAAAPNPSWVARRHRLGRYRAICGSPDGRATTSTPAGQRSIIDRTRRPSFAARFHSCGPGSTTVLAQTDSCAALCWRLSPGVTTGSSQINFTALDDAGRTLTFSTPRVTLQ